MIKSFDLWLRRFHAEITSAGSVIACDEGTESLSDAFKAIGLSYVLVPAKDHVDYHWFLRTHAAQPFAGTTTPLRPFVAIHWPYFLNNARNDPNPTRQNRPPQLRRAALELLDLSIPLIEQYDLYLAELLRSFARVRQTNPSDLLCRGETSEDQGYAFDRHMRALVSNTEFLAKLRGALDGALAASIPQGVVADRLKLGSWASQSGSVYDIATLPNYFPKPTLVFDDLERVPQVGTLNFELRRVLGSLPEEGVHFTKLPRGTDLCVLDFHAMVREARKQERWDSVLLHGLTPALYTESSLEQYADTARRNFIDWAGTRLSPRYPLSPERVSSLVVCSPYNVQLSVPALYRAVHAASKRAASALRRARRAAGYSNEKVPRKVPVVTKTFVSDDTHEIHLTYRRNQLHASLPFAVPLGTPRLAGTYRVNGEILYSLRGLSNLSKHLGHDQVLELFTEWLSKTSRELTPARFDYLLRDRVYNAKLEAAAKTDEEPRLRAFYAKEDDVLLDILLTREAKRSISRAERERLLAALPGRKIPGILRRFEELGKAYAQRVGWAAYTQSMYCFYPRRDRRAQWMSEGVRL